MVHQLGQPGGPQVDVGVEQVTDAQEYAQAGGVNDGECVLEPFDQPGFFLDGEGINFLRDAKDFRVCQVTGHV